MNSRRFIAGVCLALFVGLAVLSAVFFWQTRQEYNRYLQAEAADRRKLAEAQAKLQEEERVLDRLRHDPAYVEKMIRQQLGYVKPGEFVFRFEQ